jgi:hypothetical protein
MEKLGKGWLGSCATCDGTANHRVAWGGERDESLCRGWPFAREGGPFKAEEDPRDPKPEDFGLGILLGGRAKITRHFRCPEIPGAHRAPGKMPRCLCAAPLPATSPAFYGEVAGRKFVLGADY